MGSMGSEIRGTLENCKYDKELIPQHPERLQDLRL